MEHEMDMELAQRLAELDQRGKSNTRRIEKLELQTDALNKLATSVELLVAEQRHQTEAMLGIKADIDKLDGKVELLEHKPARRWEAMVEKTIWAVLAAVIAFVLARVGL